MGPVCACTALPLIASRANNASQGAAREFQDSVIGKHGMAVIVTEFDPACKVEAGDKHPFAARQAGGRPQAETAGLHAIDGAGPTQRLHALLAQ